MAKKKLDGVWKVKINNLCDALNEDRITEGGEERLQLRLRSAIGAVGSMERVLEFIPPDFHERLNQIGAVRHG